MDVSDLYSNYSSYSSYLTSETSSYEKVSNSLNVSEDSTDEELMDACKSFEEYFMEKIFNSMLETTKIFSDDDDESDSYASQMVDYFKDTAVQALTEASSEQGGIGLAKQLYEQMKLQYSAISPSSLEEEE